MSFISKIRARSGTPSPAANPAQRLQGPGEERSTAQRRSHDALTDALIFLAAFHGRAVSKEALLAGLPILDGHLTAGLFDRAAARAGLEVQPARRPLADISSILCPVVLIAKDGSVRILTKSQQEQQIATVVDPSRDTRPREVAFDRLRPELTDYVFLVRPAATADERLAASGDLPKAHWFWSVVKRFWSNYSHVAIAAILVNLLALASPLFFMNVYDRVIPNGAIASLVALSIGMIISLVFDLILRIVRSRIIDMTGKKIDVVLAANIFEHIMSIKMAQRPTSVGILANQLRDFDSVRDFFTSGTVVSVTDLLFALLFITVLFAIAGPLAFIPLVMLPIMIVIGLILQRPLDQAMRRLQAESSARHSILVESLSGIETIRASGAEARVQTLWERSVAAAARSSEDVNFWASLAVAASNSAQQLTSVLIIVIGVFLIISGSITVGALVAANMLAGRVLAPISGITAVITRGTQTLIALRAIDKLMSLERERPPERTYVARPIKSGRVIFDRVTFQYPNAPTKALQNVSFTINHGERVGVIGRIGSGKTTVGRLLTGFYEPEDGRVLVDQVDIRQYDPADLRNGVGFVLQDTELFFGKIRDNIAFGKPAATDEEILEAATLAGVEEFISKHPLGYDMPIAEGGRSISGGQKQAIGLARALIRKPRILFLDEPTAHFDIRSESEFLERLKRVTSTDTTIIISTHRLSVLSLVDRLLVFDQGRLIADGPRDKVLAALRGGGTEPQAKDVRQTANG